MVESLRFYQLAIIMSRAVVFAVASLIINILFDTPTMVGIAILIYSFWSTANVLRYFQLRNRGFLSVRKISINKTK